MKRCSICNKELDPLEACSCLPLTVKSFSKKPRTAPNLPCSIIDRFDLPKKNNRIQVECLYCHTLFPEGGYYPCLVNMNESEKQQKLEPATSISRRHKGGTMNKKINIYQATKDGLLKYFATNYDNDEVLFTDVSLTSILARIRLTHPDYNIFNVVTNTWIDYNSNNEQQKLEPATRYDAGKIPYHLFPLDAFEEICKVMQFGTKKYDERNWEQGMSWSRVARSMFSHFISMCKGIERDEESGCTHAGHMAWNAIVLLAYTLRPKLHNLNDLSNLYSGSKD